MAEIKDRSRRFVGGSSLLMIFAVLCLTVFALLAVGSARSAARLSDASADACAAYYSADVKAEEIFARIREGNIPDGVTADGGNVYSYSVAISDGLDLSVSVRQNEDGGWTVVSRRTVSRLDDGAFEFGS